MNLDQNDKYSKLRPLIDHFQKKFIQYFVPEENISHDKAMIEYFGKHGCKQTILNKPIRFGYKVRCQNTVTVYLVAFELYQGNIPNSDKNIIEKLGKTSATVTYLLSKYNKSKCQLPYHLYIDNLFTSFALVSE